MGCAHHAAQSGMGHSVAGAAAADVTDEAAHEAALPVALTAACGVTAGVKSRVTPGARLYAASFQRSVSPARSGTMPEASR